MLRNRLSVAFAVVTLCATPSLAGQTKAASSCDVALVTRILDAEWQRYLASGRTDENLKTAFRAHLDSEGRRCGHVPAFVEAEVRYLQWMGDHAAAKDAFATLRDDEINDRAHFVNRLRARYLYGTDPAVALPMLRRALGGSAPALRDKAVQWVHEDLAPHYAPVIQGLVQTPAYESFFVALQDPSSPDVAAVTAGLRLWVRAAKAADPSALRDILAESWAVRAPDARAERYRLLIAGLMDRHEVLRDDAVAARERVVRELLSRLSAAPPLRERYWLACAHYAQGQALLSRDRPRALQELREAARWAQVLAGHNDTIDVSDEAARLGAPVDIKSAAAKALEDAGALADALVIEVEIALRAASHVPAVRRLHALVHPAQPFEMFWMQTLDSRLPMAPDFDLPGSDGTRLRLASLRGRWVLLDFWGTWCTACVPQMPKIQALHDELSAKTADLACVVTIAARDQPEGVQAFVAKHGYTFPALLADHDVVERFGIDEYPSKRLVTPTGRLIQVRDDEWEETFRAYVLGQDEQPRAPQTR